MWRGLIACVLVCGCSSEPESGITSLTADKAKLNMGESTTVTATIDIPGTIASASMMKDGNAIGTLTVDPMSPNVYHATLTWMDIVRATSASKVGATEAESIEARFIDDGGKTSTKAMTIDLWCGTAAGVCRSGCSMLDDVNDCGKCGNTCGMVTLEADPSTSMSGGINDTRCAGPAAGLECGDIVYYQNASSTRGPRTCKDICESQTHGGHPLKCSPFCGSTQGSIDFGNGSMPGEAWYLMQTSQKTVAITSCDAAPAATNSGLPLNETRCCCITQ